MGLSLEAHARDLLIPLVGVPQKLLTADTADERWMGQALALADRGRGWVNPNPMVGCVVVNQGRVVGQGWHSSFGGPHAETEALNKAGRRARGATLYVTLEPCPHWGKTPPCADAVAAAGVKRVVIGGLDPTLGRRGRGVAKLKANGIAVKVGVLEQACRHLNRAFFKSRLLGLPYLILKTAQSLDGKTASVTGQSRWITSPLSRKMGHWLRAWSEGILVGGETLRRDNPSLSSHGLGLDPQRLVITQSLDIPWKSKLFKGSQPAWVFAVGKAGKSLDKNLKLFVKNGFKDIRNVLRYISKIGINEIFVESGGNLAYSLVKENLVDELFLFVAPILLGGQSAPTSLGGEGYRRPDLAPRLSDISCTPVGDDFLIHGYF